MFQQEFYGYNKKEVEDFLKRIKTTYEAKVLALNLKVLELEKQLLDLKSEEKKIMSALDVFEKQKKYQEEGSKIYGLIVNKIELLVDKLNTSFPQLQNDKDYTKIYEELNKLVASFKNGTLDGRMIPHPISQENDSMRALLMKMQEHKRGQDGKEQQKTSNNTKTEQENMTIYKTPEVISDSPAYISPMAIPDNGSGFSFAEALNPTDDLDEIMKAFDFYGN